ncbi:MAG: class I tRNA ligase family protein, partial [Candidatus Sumerlaeia bacterium]|nr:class I tRNA ligase family protein [Candidatus Sumerlaeia bacterium]
GIGARDQAPYKMVLTHGYILDEKGEAMHKSKGNVISPFEIIDKLGADVLRLWVASEDYRNDVAVSFEILDRIAEAYRRIRNTIRFLLGNLYDFVPGEDTVKYSDLPEFDRWALHQLAELIRNVTEAYDNFEFHKVFHLVHKFCVVEMSSIYLDVLKDRLYCSGKKSLPRCAAQTVLYHIVSALIRAIAPILVFTAEESWRYLVPEATSVHLADFPVVPEEWLDEKLNASWEQLLAVREKVLVALERARRERIIGHSLDARVVIFTPNSRWLEFLDSYKNILAELFIVSAVEVAPLPAEKMLTSQLEDDEKPLPVYVEVSSAAGKKCERCWRYDVHVGSNAEYESLCERCIKVLREV